MYFWPRLFIQAELAENISSRQQHVALLRFSDFLQVQLSSQDVESFRPWVILSKFIFKQHSSEISKVFVPLPKLKHNAYHLKGGNRSNFWNFVYGKYTPGTDNIQRNIGITEVDLRQVSWEAVITLG
jgi:hypothetical protein